MLLTRLWPLAVALAASVAVGWGLTQLSRPRLAFDAGGAVAARDGSLYLPLAALLGLGVGTAIVLRRERRRRPVHGERDLAAAVRPLLGARPAQEAALRALCAQLLAHWFTAGRAILPVVGAAPGEGRTRLAARLALMFSAMGVRTLLVDADLRSPGQHREFRVENRGGLAELLQDREVQPAVCNEHLALLVAGRASRDPLELLGRPRLRELLEAAGKRFRVILVDTPAAALGPDLAIFAALGGGALVVHRKGADGRRLEQLKRTLDKAHAEVVSVLFT